LIPSDGSGKGSSEDDFGTELAAEFTFRHGTRGMCGPGWDQTLAECLSRPTRFHETITRRTGGLCSQPLEGNTEENRPAWRREALLQPLTYRRCPGSDGFRGADSWLEIRYTAAEGLARRGSRPCVNASAPGKKRWTRIGRRNFPHPIQARQRICRCKPWFPAPSRPALRGAIKASSQANRDMALSSL